MSIQEVFSKQNIEKAADFAVEKTNSLWRGIQVQTIRTTDSIRGLLNQNTYPNGVKKGALEKVADFLNAPARNFWLGNSAEVVRENDSYGIHRNAPPKTPSQKWVNMLRLPATIDGGPAGLVVYAVPIPMMAVAYAFTAVSASIPMAAGIALKKAALLCSSEKQKIQNVVNPFLVLDRKKRKERILLKKKIKVAKTLAKKERDLKNTLASAEMESKRLKRIKKSEAQLKNDLLQAKTSGLQDRIDRHKMAKITQQKIIDRLEKEAALLRVKVDKHKSRERNLQARVDKLQRDMVPLKAQVHIQMQQLA